MKWNRKKSKNTTITNETKKQSKKQKQVEEFAFANK